MGMAHLFRIVIQSPITFGLFAEILLKERLVLGIYMLCSNTPKALVYRKVIYGMEIIC